MKRLGTQEQYNIHHQGSFGVFYSGNSFPIAFVQTSINASEMEDLTFAREIKPDVVDFDLLLQRDIDEERIAKKIEPYLTGGEKGDSIISSKSVFFPPLLVAVVPAEGDRMLEYYADERVVVGQEIIEREWPGFIKLTFFKGENASSLSITDPASGITYGADKEPAKISVKKVKGHSEGVHLVVIDGQHRLYALREVYEQNKDLIKDLVIPVCILFPPNATNAAQIKAGEIKLPSVSEVFRHLFVDVNSTMEKVGGHFTILLSDENIGRLVCRKFCEHVLSERGQKGLSAIEWNTKSHKESSRIVKPYSITSIGIIDLALSDEFGKNGKRRVKHGLLKYVAGLENISNETTSDEDDPTAEVEWDKFSLSQKHLIEESIKKKIVKYLDKIFFESDLFGGTYKIYAEEISSLEKEVKTAGEHGKDIRNALSYIVDYIPIPKGKKYEGARIELDRFYDTVQRRKKESFFNLGDYAIFQRAVIHAWLIFMDAVKEEVSPDTATDLFINLFNRACQRNAILFSPSNRYMQYSVFSRTKIKPNNETKNALSRLVLAPLGSDDFMSSFMRGFKIDNQNALSAIRDRLIELGQGSASHFLTVYRSNRNKDFISGYKVDLDNLTEEDRDNLKKLENIYNNDRKLVREKKIRKQDVSTAFHETVRSFVYTDVEEAALELKSALSYESDIIEEDADQAEE